MTLLCIEQSDALSQPFNWLPKTGAPSAKLAGESKSRELDASGSRGLTGLFFRARNHHFSVTENSVSPHQRVEGSPDQYGEVFQ